MSEEIIVLPELSEDKVTTFTPDGRPVVTKVLPEEDAKVLQDMASGGAVESVMRSTDEYVNRGLEKLQMATAAVNLDELSEDLGIGKISNQLTKDRLKTALAAYALYKLFRGMAGNLGKVAVAGGAIYLISKKKEYIRQIFNKNEYISSRLIGPA